MKSLSLPIATLIVALLCGSGNSFADNWPGFHGLGLAGIAESDGLPDQWSEKDYKWQFDLKTRDVGSMAVYNGTVYLLATVPGEPALRLLAIELESGKEKWSQSVPNAENHLHKRNTLASSTPAVDDKHVYIAHSDREHTWVRCYDHSGNEVWTRELGTAQSQHGFGTSPTVHEDKLILNFSQQAEQLRSGEPGTSRVYAFDKSNGETLWATELTSKKTCYGVPAIHDGMVIGANSGDGLYALSVDDGKMLWRNPVFKMRCVSSPIVVDGLAIGTSGSGGGGNHLVAVRIPTQPGEQAEEVYRIESGAPYVPTSVVHDGALFMVDDAGVASCADVATGKVLWKKRIGGNFGASPILVGDKCLLISLDGTATILRASREFEKLGEVDLGGPVGATPTFVDGRLLVRVGTQLKCL